MATCPVCSGPMSGQVLSRRTGLWGSTCRDCLHFEQTATPLTRPAPEPNHGAMVRQDPTRPSNTPMVPIATIAKSTKAMALRLPTLYDPPPPVVVNIQASPTLAPRVTPVIWPQAPPAAAPRVSRQATQILKRLRAGRVSVTELATMACQYNARIFELLRAGYPVVNVEHDLASGESWYELARKFQ